MSLLYECRRQGLHDPQADAGEAVLEYWGPLHRWEDCANPIMDAVRASHAAGTA